MNALIKVSLLVNLLVLVPVCFGLYTGKPWVVEAYGVETAARQILLAVYSAILILSIVFLVVNNVSAVVALLLVQVIYKLLTVYTVGSISHPVVQANVVISIIHICTLGVVFFKLSQS